MLTTIRKWKTLPTPTKSCQASTTQDDSTDDESDDEGVTTSKSSSFTPVKKKKVKKKTKPSTTAAEIENHFLKDLPSAQRKLADVADKKLKKDLDRHKAGPLFMMVLPGEMEGSYIFVCRKKYEQLAWNVLKGIVAFLTHHLHEPGAIQADRAMGKWIPKSEIQLVRRKKMVWCTRFLRAVEAETTEVQVEEALEFLDDVIEDTTDVYDGQLSIDMEMADAKDIDDGQTVTGMLDEMQERERQLEDAFVEIEARDTELAAKNQALAQQQAANAALQARLEALQSQAANQLAISSQPLPNNQVSPDRQEFLITPSRKKGTKHHASPHSATSKPSAAESQPMKKSRTRPNVKFRTSNKSVTKPSVQVDTSNMDGDTTMAVSQGESQTSSLTAASPGGVHPFFLPSPPEEQRSRLLRPAAEHLALRQGHERPKVVCRSVTACRQKIPNQWPIQWSIPRFT